MCVGGAAGGGAVVAGVEPGVVERELCLVKQKELFLKLLRSSGMGLACGEGERPRNNQEDFEEQKNLIQCCYMQTAPCSFLQIFRNCLTQ